MNDSEMNDSEMSEPSMQEALDIWFGAPGSEAYARPRRHWFKKSSDFDSILSRRFGHTVDLALCGQLCAWSSKPLGTLALILLLDQFSRNCFRDTPKAYAGDRMALSLAKSMVASGADLELPTLFHRVFVYMPFEHDERDESQEEAVRLFGQLSDDCRTASSDPAVWASIDSNLDYARRHAAVIARFGRFPHRNAVLGRDTSQEEAQWLGAHGGF